MSAFTKSRRQASIVTLILFSVMVSACGYKAPVYYPTQAQLNEIAAREARIKARKEARREAERQKKAAEKAEREAQATAEKASRAAN